jgi:hypothetical protein
MDGVHELLNKLKKQAPRQELSFLGLINVLVGRTIYNSGGNIISTGLTWRAAATWLKRVRWPKESVRELGLELKDLPPRDRERFWYTVISLGQIDSHEARTAGDRAAEVIQALGYKIGPGPGPTILEK